MKKQLIKAMQRNELLDIMLYIAKDGAISKRRIKIIKIVGDKFQTYCFNKQAKRTFTIANVLAVVPVVSRERLVI